MAKRMLVHWGGGSGDSPFEAALTLLTATPIEIGADLASPTFNAAYAGGVETFAELSDDDGNPVQDVLGSANPITRAFTYNKTVVGDTVTFTLTANDGGPNVTDAEVATWLPRLYYGVDANAALATEADIEALANSLLGADKALSTTLAPVAEYIYYAFPVSFAAAALDFQFGAFPGGFTQVVASVPVTANTAGAPTLNYQIWRSTFAQDTTVTGPLAFNVAA